MTLVELPVGRMSPISGTSILIEEDIPGTPDIEVAPVVLAVQRFKSPELEWWVETSRVALKILPLSVARIFNEIGRELAESPSFKRDSSFSILSVTMPSFTAN